MKTKGPQNFNITVIFTLGQKTPSCSGLSFPDLPWSTNISSSQCIMKGLFWYSHIIQSENVLTTSLYLLHLLFNVLLILFVFHNFQSYSFLYILRYLYKTKGLKIFCEMFKPSTSISVCAHKTGSGV